MFVSCLFSVKTRRYGIMKELIRSYETSCEMAMARINELTALRSALRKKGCESRINELALDRRIKLLYDENLQMKEIIRILDSYTRRISGSGNT